MWKVENSWGRVSPPENWDSCPEKREPICEGDPWGSFPGLFWTMPHSIHQAVQSALIRLHFFFVLWDIEPKSLAGNQRKQRTIYVAEIWQHRKAFPTSVLKCNPLAKKYSTFDGNNYKLNQRRRTENLIKLHNAADSLLLTPYFPFPFLTCLCNLCVGYCSVQLQGTWTWLGGDLRSGIKIIKWYCLYAVEAGGGTNGVDG